MAFDAMTSSDPDFRILVVDDDAGNRNSLRRFLLSKGYSVWISGSGEEAMSEMNSAPFNLVLTDIRMPGMDGMELVAWIKRTHPGTDAIIMTGYASIDTAARAVRMGAFDYLVKPFAHVELVSAAIERSITRQRAERELQLTTEKLRTSRRDFFGIVEKNVDGVIIVDRDGKVRFVNPSAVSLFGKPRNQLIGAPFGLPLIGGDMTEVDILHSGGESRIVEMSIQDTDWEGMPAHLVILHDVTAQKEMENSKTEFIANISHDLRTPLTSIKNAVDILLGRKAGEINEVQDRFLSMAERNVERLRKLINDILDISNIESNRFELACTNMDFKRCIDHVRADLDSLAHAKSISLQSRVEPDLSSTHADAYRIEQVLTNLIENAIKFTAPGGKIAIEVASAKDPGKSNGAGSIQVSVSDNGSGISEEHLSKLFDRFYRAGSAQPGTGLGLSICKKIVEAHGGKIWCESRQGEGSTFTFSLPIAKETRDMP